MSDTATLQARLVQAEQAYHALMTGANTSMVSYGSPDGIRTVTYTRTNAPQLAAYIAELKRQLGLGTRHAARVVFR